VLAADLPLKYRVLLKAYRWRRIDPVPCTQPRQPLARARVALVTSGGLVEPGTPPFDLTRKGGDPSFRILLDSTKDDELSVHHRSDAFDRGPLAEDLNVIFPRRALARLAEAGTIGAVAPRHLSFMGSITAPGSLIRDWAPQAAELLAADAVDVALLVPV
jgi:D-proline reductase (dithiol) PrdB